MNDLFFELSFCESHGEPFSVSSASCVSSCGAGYADRYLSELLAGLDAQGRQMRIRLERGIPQSVIDRAGEAYREDPEGYAIDISGDQICICAVSDRGFIYAVSTLKQLILADRVSELTLYDRPDKAIRGYRVYTPGRANIPTFKKMIDRLVYYKYNSIIIEVGGAMEYDRHPEINERWKTFCAEVRVSPDAASKIQEGYWWQKNSIHADNGDGGSISKDEMRDIVAYCRERGLEVIPEVPSLSHSDYMVLAHPELRERAEDPYPDTYCPSNPKSYELLFDVIDEVIEVFRPRFMNIGHDELYTIGLCKNCQGKDPVELYVGDIRKINDYLKARGITAMMWCEKMFYKEYDHRGVGAWAVPERGIPDMGRCLGKIPKDVMLLHWYWSLNSLDGLNTVDRGYEDERRAMEMGYRMVYGNFSASGLTNYRKRVNMLAGGFVSNWGSCEDEYMQRNSQDFTLATTAYAFWSHDYDNEKLPVMLAKAKLELQRRYESTLGKSLIKIRHTTDFDKPQPIFYDGVFIIPEDWLLGHYVVTYADGTEARLPVNFFYNIGCRRYGADSDTVRKLYGAGTPVELDGETWYETAYANPFPEKAIAGIGFEQCRDVKLDFVVLE